METLISQVIDDAITESKHVKENDIEKIVHQNEKKIEELMRIEPYVKKKLV
jgi:F420-dependent methylenetetrahydromethanopterin dehydrogenase